MKILKTNYQMLSMIMALALLPACSKSSAGVLTGDKIPGAIEQAFQQSTGSSKEIATAVINDCRNGNDVGAFKGLQTLSSLNTLTPEQRAAATHAMVGVIQKLRAASESGDQSAKTAIHQYLSTR